MSLNKILELLHNFNENNVNFNDFSKFKPNIIGKISTNIADFIYQSYNDKSAASSQKRSDVIEFLRTTCCENSGHFHVDESNSLPILNTLFNGTVEDDTQLQLFLNDLQKEYDRNKPPTVVEQIIYYYKSKLQRDTQLICKRDKFKEEMERRMPKDFNFTSSETVKPNNDLERIEKMFIKDEKIHLVIEKHVRERFISTGYSLVNINNSNQYDVFVKQIINKLCQFEILYDFEIEFLMHIFENTELVNQDLLSKFSFIFEIPIIQLSTKLIACDGKDDVDLLLMDKTVIYPYKKIFSIAQTNVIFKSNFLDICDTLFVMSDFNTNILFLINFIHKYPPCIIDLS